MKAAFWLCVALVVYSYFGYPLALTVIRLGRRRPVEKKAARPHVSFIITVHNEEKRIEAKLRNTLEQSFPRDHFEVIVASDCSNDRTDEITRAFESAGVRLVRASERRGKEAAQRLAIAEARGEVLVFSDAGTTLPADAVARIVANFADPSVGCVSGVDRVIDADGRVSGEGMYVRYEMLLRQLETDIGSVVGLSGSFFAARREVCRDWATDVPSDFRTVLSSVRLGLRGVSDRESVGHYRAVADDAREFDRKVRTVLRGMAALAKHREFLNPLQYGLFAWQLWSHKVCRWLVPFGMAGALVTNAWLVADALYCALFALQLAFYGAAASGLARGLGMRGSLTRIPAFLVLANLSIANAWYRFIRGRRVVAWMPSER